MYDYTNKWNTVAVVSDGTRVLGLGDIGPKAGLPVMEGKALLYKYLGGVDGVPIMLDTKDPGKIIETVLMLQGTITMPSVRNEPLARAAPIRPKPKTPRVLPRSGVSGLRGHWPARTAWSLSRIARRIQQLSESRRMLAERGTSIDELDNLITEQDALLDPRARKLLEIWPAVKESYSGDQYVVKIRDREIRTDLIRTTLSGTRIPKVVLPRYEDHGELLKWLLLENVPGTFPYTAGVFAFKREGEDPTRMFAGEGDAFRTNRRFKQLSSHSDAKRLIQCTHPQHSRCCDECRNELEWMI